MFESERIIGTGGLAAAILLGAMVLVTALSSDALGAQHAAANTASARGEETAASPKVHEFITLLADPGIQKWLKEEDEKKSAAESSKGAADQSVSHYFASRLSTIREHIYALASALPDLPNQFERGFGLLQAEIPRRGTVLLLVLVFAGLGFGVRVAVSQDDAEDTPAARRSPNGEGERPPTSRHCALRLCLRHRCGLRHRQRWPLLGARLAA